MFRNYLLLTLRNLKKNQGHMLINATGLGIAIACCIVAYLNYLHNMEFDTHHVHKDKIYRIGLMGTNPDGSPQRWGNTAAPLADLISANFPSGVTVVSYMPGSGSMQSRAQKDFFNILFGVVDPSFFDVFTVEMLYGSAEGFKRDPTAIMLAAKTAQKLFEGRTDVVGEVITQSLANGSLKSYTIAGVFQDLPTSNSMDVQGFVPFSQYRDFNKDYDPQDWKFQKVIFLKVEDPALLPGIQQLAESYLPVQNEQQPALQAIAFPIEPFVGMAQRARDEDIYGHYFRWMLPAMAVIVPVCMAVMLLVLAVINYINTAIAVSSNRLKEIGIRKVMGGTKQQVVGQFMAENFLFCLLSMAIGFFLAEFLVPAYSDLWPFMELKLHDGGASLFLFLLFLLVFVSVMAGSYPSFYISSFDATRILKGKVKFGGNGWLSKILLMVQFMITLTTLIAGATFYANAKFQRTYQPGFDRSRSLYFSINNASTYEVMKQALSQHAEIESIAGSTNIPLHRYDITKIKHGDGELIVDYFKVGEGLLETMGFTLLEGESFPANGHQIDDTEVIINELLMEQMGWEAAIGRPIVTVAGKTLYVKGVVKDFTNGGFWSQGKPVLIKQAAPEEFNYMMVSARPENMVKVHKQVRDTWYSIYQSYCYLDYMDNIFSEDITVSLNVTKVFGFLGFVALCLSTTGLFSLVSLNIQRRLKEIGVRKIHGQPTSGIMMTLHRNFLMIFLFACVTGTALGTFFTQALLSAIWVKFNPVSVLHIIPSIGVLSVVALATVFLRIYRASLVNPAEILKSE